MFGVSHPLKPELENLKQYLLISVVTGVAFTTYFADLTVRNVLIYVLVALLVVGTREAGIRTIVHWMDGYIETTLSTQGTVVTMFGAAISAITTFDFILLFPLFTDLDMEKFEQWGKSIDSMWAKRQFWVHGFGIFSMILAGYIANTAGFAQIAHAYALFSTFQLMPFDYPNIPTDALDGAYILRWSGWVWLIEMGLSLILIAITV